jgi:hypothetical protein
MCTPPIGDMKYPSRSESSQRSTYDSLTWLYAKTRTPPKMCSGRPQNRGQIRKTAEVRYAQSARGFDQTDNLPRPFGRSAIDPNDVDFYRHVSSIGPIPREPHMTLG